MNYYLDTEFIEGKQAKTILGIKYGETKPTIDLISIGIVAEDGREYYAISKDFNLKEAWNRFDKKVNKDYTPSREEAHYNPMYIKEYGIRDNVLKPIFIELLHKQYSNEPTFYDKYRNSLSISNDFRTFTFNYKLFKKLINNYGKTNKQIAEEVIQFVMPSKEDCDTKNFIKYKEIYSNPQFYAYYADYYWVAFCWLFGKMNDLPKGFPIYCIDLKQMLDEKVNTYPFRVGTIKKDFNTTLNDMESFDSYPKQENEHNALADAKWNKDLHEFINKL